MTQEALKLALEALEANYLLVNGTETHGGLEQCLDGYYSGCFNTAPINKQTEEAITAIKEALAQTQEPVAWMRIDGMKAMPALEKEAWLSTGRKFDKEIVEDYTIPLYTTPPQRTWVGLADEDISKISQRLGIDHDDSWADLKQAIEAKLKQKNGYAEENT